MIGRVVQWDSASTLNRKFLGPTLNDALVQALGPNLTLLLHWRPSYQINTKHRVSETIVS